MEIWRFDEGIDRIRRSLSQMSGWRPEALSATGWNQAPIQNSTSTHFEGLQCQGSI